MRIGHGWDLHRLEPGLPFRLGGVEIPFEKGAVGHSDGDPLLHALTDAFLGAAALGDIGLFFPDTDPRWKDADSEAFLKEALRKTEAAGLRPANVDVTVILERPKVGPHRAAIRENLARILGIPVDRVSLKAKTSEGVGPVGAGEAVSCHAVVLLSE